MIGDHYVGVIVGHRVRDGLGHAAGIQQTGGRFGFRLRMGIDDDNLKTNMSSEMSELKCDGGCEHRDQPPTFGGCRDEAVRHVAGRIVGVRVCLFARHSASLPPWAAMGFYSEKVLPRLIDRVCDVKSAHSLRARVCEGLHGRVVEIGFGSGLNVPFYPAAVSEVHAVEPSDVAWKLAAKRIARSDVPVHRSGLDGQVLAFADNTFDAAISTWTLCTIPDAGSALAEVRRVLKPGASLHFIEHGLAPDAKVQRWQHRLEPMQKRLAGGCHLTRRIEEMLVAADFTVTEIDVFYEKGGPKFLTAASLGVCRVSREPSRPRTQ